MPTDWCFDGRLIKRYHCAANNQTDLDALERRGWQRGCRRICLLPTAVIPAAGHPAGDRRFAVRRARCGDAGGCAVGQALHTADQWTGRLRRDVHWRHAGGAWPDQPGGDSVVTLELAAIP